MINNKVKNSLIAKNIINHIGMVREIMDTEDIDILMVILKIFVKMLIKTYKLIVNRKFDLGCGKGFLLYEIGN